MDMAPAVSAACSVGDLLPALRMELRPWAANGQAELGKQADAIAHQKLVAALSSSYPGVPIVSEEDHFHSQERPEDYFLIDPIDGTASWLEGFDGYVCQLARIRQGIVIFGVIHSPVRRMTWTVEIGRGAYLNGRPLDSLTTSTAGGPLVVVDNYPEPRGLVSSLERLIGPFQYLECGSIGLKAALIATGEADLFIKDIVVRDWDVAPAFALMREVGGYVAHPDGSDFLLRGSYEKRTGVMFARSREVGMMVSQALH